MTTQAKPRINVDKLMARIIEGGSRPCISALRQAIENARDAGAKHIDIHIVDRLKDTGYIIIADDGEGFSQRGVDSFFSIYDSAKTGRHDLIGQHGSGRLFLFQFCQRIEVYTRSKEYPQLHQFALVMQHLIDLIEKRGGKLLVEPVKKPAWLRMRKGFGSAIVIRGINWGKVPTANKIRQELPRWLSPKMAKMVTVDGEPLESREVVGERVQLSRQVDYLKGTIEVDVFVPVTARIGEGVMLGGHNSICSLRSFHQDLDEVERPAIPGILLERGVCGEIYFPELNRYRATSSDRLTSGFYEDEGGEFRLAILRFLDQEVRPLVEAAFQRRKSAEERAQRQELMEGVAETLNSAFGFDAREMAGANSAGSSEGNGSSSSGGGGSSKGLRIEPSRVTLTPGERIQFEVITPGTSGDIRWDKSESGGTGKNQGKKCSYIAGDKLSNGKPFRLVVTDRVSDQQGVAYIHIVQAHEVEIYPQNISIRQGRRRTFSLRGYTSKMGTLFWSIDTPPGVELMRRETQTTEVMVSAHAPLGERTIQVETKGGEVYKTTFRVTEAPQDEALYVCIDGTYYQLEAAHFCSTVAQVEPGEKYPVMSVYFGHDALKGGGSERVLTHILIAHLRHLLEEEESDLSVVPLELAKLQGALR